MIHIGYKLVHFSNEGVYVSATTMSSVHRKEYNRGIVTKENPGQPLFLFDSIKNALDFIYPYNEMTSMYRLYKVAYIESNTTLKTIANSTNERSLSYFYNIKDASYFSKPPNGTVFASEILPIEMLSIKAEREKLSNEVS